MAQTIHDYVVKMLEASEKTRVMHVFDEYDRIKAHFGMKKIDMQDELTQQIEEEIFAVFCEEYIHEYEYVNPHFNGFTRPLSDRESNIMAKERVLSVVSKYNDAMTYHDLLDLLGFEYHPISHLPQFVEVEGELSMYTYYETICVHKETGLTMICFLGSSATGGSFGFELTQENWDNHVNRLAEEANAAEAKRFNDVNLHLWAEELLEGVSDETRADILDTASHIGIIEGRGITEEAFGIHKHNSISVLNAFGDMPFSDAQALIHYALDCLNAKCRENGDPEIY